MRLATDFVLNQELSRVGSIPLYMDHFDGLRLKEHRKGNWRPWNQMGRKNAPGLRLDYADYLSILDKV